MKKSISNKSKLLYFLLFVLVVLIFVSFFLNPPRAKFNVLDVAIGFRDTITSTTMNSQVEDTMEVNAWDSYWFYTFLGDQLYADMTNDTSYLKESENLLEAFKVQEKDSMCLPYFLLNNLKQNSKYARTYQLAEKICYGSEREEIVDRCKNPNDCVIDEVFYSTLEELFAFSNSAFVLYKEENNLVIAEQNTANIENLITENILAYGLEDQAYVNWVNKKILSAVMEFRNNYAQVDRERHACDEINYTALLQNFFVKEKLLKDATLLDQHQSIQNGLLGYCFSSREAFNEAILMNEREFPEDTNSYDLLPLPFYIDDNVHLRMEMYFLAKDSLGLENMDEFLKELFKDDLIQRVYYESIDFSAEFSDEEWLEKSGKFLPLSKNYFYLLLHSIYEN